MTGIIEKTSLVYLLTVENDRLRDHVAALTGQIKGACDEADRIRAINAELVAVVTSAASAWDQLQQMYDGQDQEQREAGEVGSIHRDTFEAFLDGLTEDARAALAKARGEGGEE